MKSYTPSRGLSEAGLIVSLLVASTLIVMSASLSSANALSLLSISQTRTGLVTQDSYLRRHEPMDLLGERGRAGGSDDVF